MNSNQSDYISQTLVNSLSTAEGTLLPPRQVGPSRVPLATGLLCVNPMITSTGTSFVLTWTNPSDTTNSIDHYNIYALGVPGFTNQYQLIAHALMSPATIIIPGAKGSVITLFLQTVLKNGLLSPLGFSPSTTGLLLGQKAGGLSGFDANGNPVIIAPGATNTILTSAGTALPPVWTTATYPSTSTINQLLYSSAANTVSGLATANNGTLITSAGGVPSISSTLPAAVQSNITTLGTIANAVNTSTGYQISGAATAGNVLRGNGTNFISAALAETDLSDYATGSWTPTDTSGAALSFSGVLGTYVRVGKLVIITCQLTYPATADVSTAQIGGLPFTANANSHIGAAYTGVTNISQALVNASTTTLTPSNVMSGAGTTNATLSGKTVYVTITYIRN